MSDLNSTIWQENAYERFLLYAANLPKQEQKDFMLDLMTWNFERVQERLVRYENTIPVMMENRINGSI